MADPGHATALAVRDQVAAPAVPDAPRDALPALIGYVLVLVSIPSELVIGPLGAAGTPAQVLAIALFGWWVLSRLLPAGRRSRPVNPVRWLLLVFAVAVLASYTAGMSRPIANAAEVSSSDRALLSLVAWVGVVVVMVDGLHSARRLEQLLSVLAGGAVAIAVLGMLQFFLGLDIAHLVSIPGLHANQQFGELIQRSSFRRVSGTTSHPIEFGVVLSALLPLIVHLALRAASDRSRRGWWAGAAVVAAALPMSVARSALLGGAVAAVFVLMMLPARLRPRVAAVAVVGVLGISVVVPGLLGTMRSLVFNAGSDPSTKGRTDDYAPVFDYFLHAPVVGRGVGTFIPSLYRTLDNQYLGTLVEGGLLGVLALLALLLGTACCALLIRRRSDDERVRGLALALTSAAVVLLLNFAVFDALGFATCAGVLFLTVGSVGTLWALQVRPPRRRPSWRPVAFLALACAVALLGGLAPRAATGGPVQYRALAAVLVEAPPLPGANSYLSLGIANVASSVLRDAVTGEDTRARLVAEGVSGDFTVTVGDGSVMAGSDVIRSGSILHVTAVSGSWRAAQRDADLVASMLQERLGDLQTSAGVRASDQLVARRLDSLPPYAIEGRRLRSLAGLATLSLLLLLAGVSILRRRRGDATT